jgi:L-fuculose-phosphate aldolase
MSTAYDTAPRLALISALLGTAERGLHPGAGSSLSTRHHDGMLITPAVPPTNGMTADDIAFVHNDGTADGKRLPANDWRVHAALLQARPDLHTIVRLRTPAATALASLRRPLPVVHHLVETLAGGEIACGRFAPNGTSALASNTVAAMKDRNACLQANNALVVGADTPAEAVQLGLQIELLCDQYLRACAVGEPFVLAPNELN